MQSVPQAAVFLADEHPHQMIHYEDMNAHDMEETERMQDIQCERFRCEAPGRWRCPCCKLLFCDECEEEQNLLYTLINLIECCSKSLAVLIGPEGGFSKEERELLRAQSFITPMSLGPRTLRSDTASVVALTIIQTALGDWGHHFG